MYILEGNIGAGKSTFLRLLSQHMPHIQTVDEPVNNWQGTVYGQSLLTNFYEDPKRWAYTFEHLTMTNRVQEHLKEQQTAYTTKIAERSIYSGYYCFAFNSYAQQFLSDIEWQMYKEWFSFLVPNTCTPPQGFIYLRVSPEIAYDRIKRRNRHAEKTLSLAYLKQIHHRHEAFLIKKDGILPDLKRVPVLTLDCNEEFENNPAQLHRHMHAIESFLVQTGAHIPPYKHQHIHSQSSLRV
ncbi:MAG: dihydroxyacetone kinase 2 [uncultured bacterium]|nr:MAG: dihydroxyacetone kinase 2 [uncultured bacterium]